MSFAVRLSGISPFGPIFGKELRITSRRKRNHLLRIAYLAALMLFLMMAYSTTAFREDYGVAWRIQQQAQLGQMFFLTFSMFCVITMGLIAPVLTSTSISSERLGKTLPVLLMTPITSWQIISGKLFSRLLIALLLIGLSLPVLAVVRLLGGVEVEQMLAVVCLCALFALSSAALGLFYSTLLNRAYSVILLSYATMLLIYLFAPFFTALLSVPNNGPNTRQVVARAVFNPVMNVALLATPDRPMMLAVGWIPCAVVQILLTISLLGASAMVLRRYARRAGQSRPGVGNGMSRTTGNPPPTTHNHPPTTDHLTLPGPVRAVRDNPVLWREMRQPQVSGRRAVWGFIAMAMLLGLSYFSFARINVLHEKGIPIGYAWVFHSLYWLLVAVMSATAIAQEKESDTWTVLLVTPLTARAIVLGKLMGLARRTMWPTLFIVAHFAIFWICGFVSWVSCAVALWVLLTFNSVWAASGIYLSLRMKKVTTVVIANLIVPIVLFAGVPVALLVLGQLLARTERWAELTCWYLPYFYTGEALDKLSPRFHGAERMWLPDGYYNVGVTQFLAVTFWTGMAHLALAGAITWRTIHRFDRRVGRAPQLRIALTSDSSLKA